MSAGPDTTPAISPTDWAIIPKFHLGETFFACAMAPAFLDRHGGFLLRVFVPPYLKSIGHLFEHHPVRVEDVFALDPSLVRTAPGFERGQAFRWHPLEQGAGSLLKYSDCTIPFARGYLDMLGLPLGSFGLPRTPPHVALAAAERFARLSFPAGRTVILAPHSRTLTPPPTEFWLGLANRLRADGWTVCENLSATEHAEGRGLPGCLPLVCPLDQLPSIAALAGWVISARSGVCELLSSCPARLTILATYRALNPVREGLHLLWDLASSGLPDNAEYFYLGKHEPVGDFLQRILPSLPQI